MNIRRLVDNRSRALRAPGLAVLVALCVCAAAGAATAAGATSPQTSSCPILEATGVLGSSASGGTTNLGGIAGGVALGKEASGSLTIGCGAIADSLKIQVPGQPFATVKPPFAGGSCSTAGDTITCKLSTAEQQTGIKATGAWQNVVIWTYKSNAQVATNTRTGSCGVPVKITLTKGGKTIYTKTTKAVCAYALGDALK